MRAERAEIVRGRSRVIAQNEQWFVDAEVRASQRALTRMARQRTRIPSLGFLDADFLAVADKATVYRAIIDAAAGAGNATSADLQLYDTESRTLLIAEQRGFDTQFPNFFAHVSRSTPRACAAAWSSGAPVIVDRVARSPIFVGQPSLEPMLDAGSRDVASYPLTTPQGAVAGVLSFHYKTAPGQPARAALIADGAGTALSLLN